MIDDWNAAISAVLAIKQEIKKIDSKGIWKHYLPEPPATPQEIAVAEECLGYPLDPHYREFLSHANGWMEFLQSINLFGTSELRGGGSWNIAIELLDFMEEGTYEDSKLTRGQIYPIGLGSNSADVFVMTKPSTPQPGIVIWIYGSEQFRYASFDEFFCT